MWQRFTERARKVIFYAQEDATAHGGEDISTEYILLGLVRENDNLSSRILDRLGVSLHSIRAEVESKLPARESVLRQDMVLLPEAKLVVDYAYDEARNLNNNYIGTEHLLLGTIRDAQGLAGRILAKLGVTLEHARREAMALQDADDSQRARRGEPQPPNHLPVQRLLAKDPFAYMFRREVFRELILVSLICSGGPELEEVLRESVEDYAGLLIALGHALTLGKDMPNRSTDDGFEPLLSQAVLEASDHGVTQPTPTMMFLAALRAAPDHVRAYLEKVGMTYENVDAVVRRRQSSQGVAEGDA